MFMEVILLNSINAIKYAVLMKSCKLSLERSLRLKDGKRFQKNVGSENHKGRQSAPQHFKVMTTSLLETGISSRSVFVSCF